MMRHWKQRWDPNADLVFLRRLRIGDDPKKPFVYPGDPVTQAHREKLGLHRLRIWWEGRMVGLADWVPNSGRQARPEEAPEPTSGGTAVKAKPKKKGKKKAKKTVKKAEPVHQVPGHATKEEVQDFEALLADGLSWDEATAVVWPE